MYNEPDFLKLKNQMKWRYMDSLDSIRFSPSEFIDINAHTPNQLRVKQSSIEMSATILMGNGIKVPNNQLIDSFGFLRIASEIINAADIFIKKGKNVLVPIEYANYDYSHEATGGKHLKNPFLLAAYLFDKDGKDGHGIFELSAWQNFETRRKDFATFLRNQEIAIPPHFFKNPNEEILAKNLIRILNFYAIHPELIIDAAGVKGIREFMTASIANLTKEILETNHFFTEILMYEDTQEYNNRFNKIWDIIQVFKKLEEDKILDNRSEIREMLVKEDERHFSKIEGELDLTRLGVLRTFNSIYNYSSYKSTRAEQDNQTEPMELDNLWGYDEAAFALGLWARENYEISQKNVGAGYDISSNQDSFVDPTHSDLTEDTNNIDDFWEAFFDFQRCEKWNISLNNYLDQLNEFEKNKIRYDQLSPENKTKTELDRLLNSSKKYEEYRYHHIDNKAMLWCYENTKVISKIQIEDFAEHASLTKEEKSSAYAKEKAIKTTNKGRTAEYGK